MSESPPSAKRFSEQDAWIYGGVGTAAFSTVLGAGLFGFYEDHKVLGTIFTAIGACGLIAMVILLKGHRLTIIHSAMAALVATWLYFGYMLWDGPHTIVQHEPATAEEISQFAAPLIAEKDASRQQATSAQIKLEEAIKEAAPLKAKLEEGNKQIANLQVQLTAALKERDTAQQQASSATQERDAANQRLMTGNQQPSPSNAATPQESLSETDISTKIDLWHSIDSQMDNFAAALNGGYHLLDVIGSDIKSNKDEYFQKIQKFRNAYDSAVQSLNNLRNSYTGYYDIQAAIDPNVHSKLAQSAYAFLQAVQALPTPLPNDYENSLRPYSGAFRRDLDAIRSWQSSTRQLAIAKGKELSAMGSK